MTVSVKRQGEAPARDRGSLQLAAAAYAFLALCGSC
jgi:hypothetical protein